MHPPPPTPLSAGGGLEPPTKFSNSGGLDRSFTFRGGLLEKREVIFFRGVMVERVRGGGVFNFHIKNKLKSEIFNDKKKFISKNFKYEFRFF